MNHPKLILTALTVFLFSALVAAVGAFPTNKSVHAQEETPVFFTTVFHGQGFDACALPGKTSMEAWMKESPYKVVNLYGGPLHACPSKQANRTRVQELMQEGWKFIPTWVGPQSQCWAVVNAAEADQEVVRARDAENPRRINADPALAYTQGISEADAALEWATTIGLTDQNGAKTILYYDLEYFGASTTLSKTACITAAQSFLDGWSERIQEKGNLAGLYTTACMMPDYANTIPPLDAVWIARYLIPYQYRPDAKLFGLPCLKDTLWSNQQRIVQYAGGHAEMWGGITLTIDSNVIDGIVALGNPSLLPSSTGAVTATISITATPTPSLEPSETFEVISTGVPSTTATLTGTLTPVSTDIPISTVPADDSVSRIYLPLISRQQK